LQEFSSFNFKRCKPDGHTRYTVRYLTALCDKRGTHRQALLGSISIRRLSFCREPRANKPSNHNWIVGLNRLFLVCMTPAYISVLLSNQHYFVCWCCRTSPANDIGGTKPDAHFSSHRNLRSKCILHQARRKAASLQRRFVTICCYSHCSCLLSGEGWTFLFVAFSGWGERCR
jgi:hypothetical protein